MYRPNNFAENRPDVLCWAMREIGLGILTTPHEDGIEITHIPWVVKQEGRKVFLEGHVARPNPHWRIGAGRRSAVIFQGPHAYVSPSLYPSKKIHGKAVPTWTYIAVHAHGVIEAIEDADWLTAHVNELTDAHEAGRDEPWTVSEAPVPYMAALKRGIVGLRISVDRLEGVWKVNQHKSDADMRGTVEGLSREGESAALIAGALATYLEE